MCPKLVTLVISEPLGSQTSPPTRVSLCLSSGTRKDSMIRFLTTSTKPSPTSRASCSAAQQCWYPQDGLISDQRAADQGHAKVPLSLHTYTLSSMSNLNLPDATPLWPDPTPFLGAGTTSQTQLPSPSLKAKNTSVPTKPFTSLISSSSFSIPIFLIILDILDVKI